MSDLTPVLMCMARLLSMALAWPNGRCTHLPWLLYNDVETAAPCFICKQENNNVGL